MIKMYSGEVLSKFPVVQHFPFGSLFSWDQDPTAMAPTTSLHAMSQPSTNNMSPATTCHTSVRRGPQDAKTASWAGQSQDHQPPMVQTAAPWASKSTLPSSTVTATGMDISPRVPMKAPRLGVDTRASARGMLSTQVPWAMGANNPNVGSMPPPTRAPSTKPQSGSENNGRGG